MFNEKNLKQLLETKAPDLMLSVYLNTDPSQGNAESYKLRLRNMLKNVTLQRDVEAVTHFINSEYDWAGRSLAIFSCQDNNLFEYYPLQIQVKDLVHVSERPSVRTMSNLLENYGGYGVILVDKQGARLFNFHLGVLQEQDGVVGEIVKKVKRGGASSFPGRRGGIAGRSRAADELVDRNMKEIIDFAVSFFEQQRIRRILVAGTDDNISLFLNHLPKSWQSLVVGSFAMDMNASNSEVIEKAMLIGQRSEKKREIQLVNDLITNAKKMNNAILGLENTLLAINEKKVGTLVISEDFHHPGFRCPEHGLSITRSFDSCDEDLEEVVDVIDLAVSAVLRQGGEVEVVEDIPEFMDVGSIGANLRY